MKKHFMLLIMVVSHLIAHGQPDPAIIKGSREAAEAREFEERMRGRQNTTSLGEALLLGGIIFGIVGATHMASSKATPSSTNNYHAPIVTRNNSFHHGFFILEGGVVAGKESINENWRSPGRRVSGDVGLGLALTPTLGPTRVYIKGFYATRGFLLDFNDQDVFVNSSVVVNPESDSYKLLEEGNIEMRYQYLGAGLAIRVNLGKNVFTDLGSGMALYQNAKVIFHPQPKDSESKKYRYLDKGIDLKSQKIGKNIVDFPLQKLHEKLYYELGLGYGEKEFFFRAFLRTYNLKASSGQFYPFVETSKLNVNKKFYIESSIALGINLK